MSRSAGLSRAGSVGIVAAGTAALAGWGAVTGIGHLVGATPTVGGSLVQVLLGGLAILVVFLGVAWLLDRRDLAPLTRRLIRRPPRLHRCCSTALEARH